MSFPPINLLSVSSPPNNKKMKKPSQSTMYPSLPDDLVLSCLARVPRSYYPALSLVSKRFRSLLASPELYKTRSLLGRTENCLYVCLQLDADSNPRWFTLYLKPHIENKKERNSTGHLLVPVPSPNVPSLEFSSIVAVDSNIYEIGGHMEDNKRSTRVSILDCRYHTWHEALSMQVARRFAAAKVLDGKIYVAGGYEEGTSSNWMEVFDPRTQTWESLSSSDTEKCSNAIVQSKGTGGKIQMYGLKSMSYDIKEGTQEAVEWMPCFTTCYCVIDNLLYFYYDGALKWFDNKVKIWRSLKGLQGVLPNFVDFRNVRLADCGGNLMVLWDDYAPGSGHKEKVIWCAEIVLERCNSEEVLGKVEWFDSVLTVPKSYDFVRVLATMV